MTKQRYFAAQESDRVAGVLESKANAWFSSLTNNRYLEKVRESWAAYHGAYYDSSGHRIIFGGEQGELAHMAVNHIRNLAQNMLVTITSTRPALEARAVNSDYKSKVQTQFANKLLDYYMREKRLEDLLRRAVEYAISMGTGYIKMEWNSTSGDVYDYNEETATEIREGDVQFTNLSVFDVVYDSTKEYYSLQDWVLCRSFKNKYDIAAKYPELEEKILAVQTKSELYRFRFDVQGYDDTDDVPVYEFFHKRTESMPDGRYLLYLTSDVVLLDVPMPYRELPVYRICPSEILGTPYGYTPVFDLLPIQDATNSLYSTILTNQNAFGVQNIAIPHGTNIMPTQIAGGLNIFEYNPQYGAPSALNLLQTSPETFKFLDMLERSMETISGVNSVSRGNPPPSLQSGSALALVQSMSLQFLSGLQQSYVRLMEDVGSGLVNMLKDFASVPRVAAIVGKDNRTKMQEFTGDDLSSINRVIVDVGNPLSRTTAGKLEMANNLLQYKHDSISPNQYFQVLTTGTLDSFVSEENRSQLLIDSENEALMSGDVPVQAILTDEHMQHIKCHRSVLDDAVLRQDADLVNRVLTHIQEHINQLKTADPSTLMAMNQQPIQEAPPAPPGPPQALANPEQAQTQNAVQLSGAQPPGMPNMPNMPQGFEGQPSSVPLG